LIQKKGGASNIKIRYALETAGNVHSPVPLSDQKYQIPHNSVSASIWSNSITIIREALEVSRVRHCLSCQLNTFCLEASNTNLIHLKKIYNVATNY